MSEELKEKILEACTVHPEFFGEHEFIADRVMKVMTNEIELLHAVCSAWQCKYEEQKRQRELMAARVRELWDQSLIDQEIIATLRSQLDAAREAAKDLTDYIPQSDVKTMLEWANNRAYMQRVPIKNLIALRAAFTATEPSHAS